LGLLVNRTLFTGTLSQPMARFIRNSDVDTTAMLEMTSTVPSDAPYIIQGKVASATKWGITEDGEFYGTTDNTNATFGFVGDEDTGIGTTLGIPCIMDEGACAYLFSATTMTLAGSRITSSASTSSDGIVEVTNTGQGQGVYGIAQGSGANSIGVEGEATADISSVTGGFFHALRGIGLEGRQEGSTSSSTTAPALKAVRNITLGGGAAASGPVFLLQDASGAGSTGYLMDLQKPANTSLFHVTGAGELNFAGVNADGTGKALCVKSDGDIGTCSTVPNGSGVCTCA